MFDQYSFDPGQVQGQYYDLNNPQFTNWATGFSGGNDSIVSAYDKGNGTYAVRRIRPGGDPHWTQEAMFRVDPSTGQATQVGDWGGDQKDSPPGPTIAQGALLATLAAGGLGAAGFFGGAGAGVGAAGAVPFESGFTGSGALSGIGGEGALGGTATAFGGAPFADAGAVESGFTGSGALSGLGGGGSIGAGAAPVNALDAYYGGLGGVDGSLVGSGFTGVAPASASLLPAGVGGGSGVGGILDKIGLSGISNNTLLNVGGNLLSGFLGSNAANKAADAQIAAADRANALAKYMYDTTRSDNMPALQARNYGLTGYQNLLNNPGSVTSDPGYQFGLNQGVQALDRSAAARGNLYSGQQIKAAQRYGQDYGGTKYDAALNRQGNLAGLGQIGAQTIANSGQNYANNAGQNMLGQGNAQGSAYVGSSNAWNGAIGNALNNYQQQQFLQPMLDDWLKKHGGG